MKATIGRIVIVKGAGVQSNGVNEQPAVVNRVWSGADTAAGVVCVNVTVLPDCGTPFCKTSIRLHDSRESAEAEIAAAKACASPFEVDCVAFWPDRV